MPITLKPHQNEVKNFFARGGRGLLVIHGLGSGKTFTSIAASEAFPNASKTVVLTPAKLRENYKKALDQFGPKRKKYQVLSHTQLGRMFTDDPDSVRDLLRGVFLVVDEAHNLREPGRLETEALRSKGSYAAICMLTGTPFVNGPEDIITLLELIPGLRSTVTKAALGSPKVLKDTDTMRRFAETVAGASSVYLPENPAGYPRQVNHVVYTPFSPDQFMLYVYYAKQSGSLRLMMPKEASELASPTTRDMVFINKVRQVSNVVSYWKKNPERFLLSTPKLRAMMETVMASPGPVLIYSNFLASGVEPIAWALEHATMFGARAPIKYRTVTGKQTDRAVREAVAEYNAGRLGALLISGAGGEGLDLKGTRQIHIMEQFWHGTRTDQVTGRGVRFLSHEHLPESARQVDVYMYVGEYPSTGSLLRSDAGLLSRLAAMYNAMTMPKLTADSYLKMATERKANAIAEFMFLVDMGSIGCRSDRAKCPDPSKRRLSAATLTAARSSSVRSAVANWWSQPVSAGSIGDGYEGGAPRPDYIPPPPNN